MADQPEEGLAVHLFVKQRTPAIARIEDVVADPCHRSSCGFLRAADLAG